MDAIRNSTGKLLYWDLGDIDARLHQLAVGLGVTWQLFENVSVYGGLLVHHVRLNQNMEWEWNSDDEGEPMTLRAVFRNPSARSMCGGYLGLQWQITNLFAVSIEGSATGNSRGGSVACSMAF